ncbi:hypothetical protein Tsubulata_039893 [Turnera subulata]|uniref:NAC domain-containing protein n=1 Tax=Turnera subulata TaxID=218843 RepID=A0A9Q0FRV0_9ROSI|nr:hypothetical protein Tsubulata_046223 [Turnera subulata]KAJ4836530.1 hypothetical protein Tsubulata_039893 [Turnera subulata]
MAQLVLPPSCNPIPSPPSWNRRPKRKRPEDDDDGGGGGGKRRRNPNPPLPPATATATAPPPPPCSNQVLSSSSCSSEDPYVIALRQFGMHLPRGYYFKPTMDQLVGHYLLRKINGTLSPIDIALIPECDVYGDEEPWDIWSRFGVADDRSLFLFSPLKKKSANGTVNARRVGSEGGTWHEESKKHHPVDGMILKAVERQFTYRKLNSPKNRKCPWFLKEFTLDNYPGGNYGVCELRKKGCDSAVCPPDSHFAPLPCHLLSSSSTTTTTEMMITPHDDSSPPPGSLLPSSTTETELVEDSEYAAELDHILANIDFSGCEEEEITSSPSQ